MNVSEIVGEIERLLATSHSFEMMLTLAKQSQPEKAEVWAGMLATHTFFRSNLEDILKVIESPSR